MEYAVAESHPFEQVVPIYHTIIVYGLTNPDSEINQYAKLGYEITNHGIAGASLGSYSTSFYRSFIMVKLVRLSDYEAELTAIDNLYEKQKNSD